MPQSWLNTLHSEVNAQFVSNPYPAYGERITIRLRVSSKAPLKTLWLRGLRDGLSMRQQMYVQAEKELFSTYACEIVCDAARFHYSFEIETPEGFFFYTRKGIHTIHPTEDNDFVILTDLVVPSWVPGAVFYQIFPDRFKNGNPGIGVKEGEYTFDGHPVTRMNWSDPPLEYQEGFCLDFYNGDLAGIEQALPYLQDLGITALYLNPIFSAKTTHRYDCTDYFHVDEHLGGDEALIQLTETAHGMGIRIIVDVSINHTGIEHVWFKKAQENPDSEENSLYYRNDDGSFVYWFDVPTLPQLNFGNQNLRRLIWEAEDALVRKFVKPPFLLDGWRFDVANQVGRHGKDQFCHEIWREIRKAVKEENPEAYIIGEHWEDPAIYLQGDQWDSAMNYFASGRPLRRWSGERDRFLTKHWGHDPEADTPATGFELAEAIEQHLSHIPNQLVFQQYNLINSHDTPRLYNHTAIFHENIHRGVIMALYLLPGAVSLYYGDEILLTGHVRSMEGARYPMDWNTALTAQIPVFQLYRELGSLRKKHQSLQTGSFRILYADQETFACARFLWDEAFVLIVNRAEEPKLCTIPLDVLGAISFSEVCIHPGAVQAEASLQEQNLTIKLEAANSHLFLCKVEA